MISTFTENKLSKENEAAKYFFKAIKWKMLFLDIKCKIIERFHNDRKEIK